MSDEKRCFIGGVLEFMVWIVTYILILEFILICLGGITFPCTWETIAFETGYDASLWTGERGNATIAWEHVVCNYSIYNTTYFVLTEDREGDLIIEKRGHGDLRNE